MEKHVSAVRVFALQAYSVMRDEKGQYHVAATAHFGAKQGWSKPYANLQRATLAIARKLQAEFQARDKRLS